MSVVPLLLQAATWSASISLSVTDLILVSVVAEINQLVAEAMQLKGTLDMMVPLYFGTDARAISAWHTATHVERAPKTKWLRSPKSQA